MTAGRPRDISEKLEALAEEVRQLRRDIEAATEAQAARVRRLDQLLDEVRELRRDLGLGRADPDAR